MALKKLINLSSGYSAEYIKINSVHISFCKEEFDVRVSLSIYKDSISRSGGKDPVATNYDTQLLHITKSDLNSDNLFRVIYIKLKALQEYSDSTDV